ncbi:serine/threonine protein kinase [Catenovulum agarivorans DS-2]|uniref:Stress response kinase A n=1 Tax=Catenovulum agarivorans DS-2 TaxID=1328313 RepID=W7QTZ7_9ALTE|nr:serine/threonine protein kinase [Catenovulum agarivorans]EWH08915.1 serine/threonine protein kinase [Catenovulum agarivorans DS-2]
MSDDFSFSSLTPDLILDAIESLSIYPQSGLIALNSYENRVYQFVCDDNKRYVVKFYRPQRWTDQQIVEEHIFAQQLAEAEVPMVAPLIINQQSLHHHQGYRFTLYPSVGGRAFENDNLDHLEWMGRFIGRIHQVGHQQAFTHRPSISTKEYLLDAQKVILECPMLPSGIELPFKTIVQQLVERCCQAYQVADYTQLRLHGDCHAGNILWRDGPFFVDLDDSRMGPAIQDIWMMLSGERNQQLLQLETMIEGYEEFSSFDPRELKLIEPLRAMRMVHYMGWIAKRWADPAFQHSFSWFAEQRYWEQQILAFKEQLAALEEEPLRLMSGL